MTQPAPKFAVGEEVIICSIDAPHLNGETIVTHREWLKCKDRITGEVSIGWKYKTASKMIAPWWRESALRKKHKPADQSFAELIESLKQPKKVSV